MAELSPESMGQRMGLSGMTLRRWEKMKKDKDLPEMYEKAAQSVICELVSEGKLNVQDKFVRQTFDQFTWAPFEAAVANLGITAEKLVAGDHSSSGLIEGLSEVGGSPERRKAVDGAGKQMSVFKKFGADWAKRISDLQAVLGSPMLHSFDKLVAYGALFYLLTPIDLIPDHIPVFGFLDDFAVLGFALNYYAKRFPNLM